MPREIDTTAIDNLKRFDALERSFIDCYTKAVEICADPYVRQQLEECQRSHQMRTDILVEEIEDLGGDRDVDRRDATVVLGDVAGELAMHARLCELEDLGLATYRRAVDCADFDVRDLVEGDLIPEQERTHAILSSLQPGA